MNSLLRKLTALISLLLIVLGVYALIYLKRLGPLPAGYVSHTICSGVFIAGREFDEVLAHDVQELQRRLTRTHIKDNLVITNFGFWPIGSTSKTVFRPGLGC